MFPVSVAGGAGPFFSGGIESIAVAGPYNIKGHGETPARRKIFVCHPEGPQEESPCAKKILASPARRAYRRPVTDADLQALLGFYSKGRSKGDFDAGIKMAIRGMLLSPWFLFRAEYEPPDALPEMPYQVPDVEMASRLSFFLWSSAPDDQLIELAEHEKLKDPQVLEQQVRRMLADFRSRALVENFATEWLYLRNLRKKTPDPIIFPDFDSSLRHALQHELELFLGSNLREDRSVVELLDANYTFLNERLARHYGIPGVFGNQFRRVALQDEARRGLLGKGGLLMVTSYNTRTSPTLRGKWLLENILGTPPPPPPPNVPSLKDDNNAKAMTMRQRMEQHRANPVCASCHSRMDPLGFAL